MSLLEVKDLTVDFHQGRLSRAAVQVLHGVSLDVREGECVGLVGESGSGKSTLGKVILGLVKASSGEVIFRHEAIHNLRQAARRAMANQIQVVFQDPNLSLNPSMEIRRALMEPLIVRKVPRQEAERRAREVLDQVALPTSALAKLPREFSGGQRQRIAIARALTVLPELIVCDEPVSALDLRTQDRILALLRRIQEETGVAYLFISHDLAVVRYLSHRVAVLYRGDIVEFGDGDAVTARPSHPYTQKLMLSGPVPDPRRQAQRRAERRQLLDNPIPQGRRTA